MRSRDRSYTESSRDSRTLSLRYRRSVKIDYYLDLRPKRWS